MNQCVVNDSTVLKTNLREYYSASTSLDNPYFGAFITGCCAGAGYVWTRVVDSIAATEMFIPVIPKEGISLEARNFIEHLRCDPNTAAIGFVSNGDAIEAYAVLNDYSYASRMAYIEKYLDYKKEYKTGVVELFCFSKEDGMPDNYGITIVE